MSWLIKWSKKDPQAFARLYQEHVNATYQYCAHRLNSSAEAEDLTSQVWELVLKEIRSLQSDDPIVFRAWLFQITKRELYRFFEKKKKAPAPLNEAAERVEDSNDAPHLQAHGNEQKEFLRRLVNALPEQQRETVALHFFSDLKNKEIAQIMDLSEKTVASNLCRALDTLRSWLKKVQ